MLHVTAIQEIISSRTVRIEGLTCIKCRQTGHGEMVRYMNGYVHLEECAPEINLLTEAPKLSRWAEIIYNLPEGLRKQVVRWTGAVECVHGLDPSGNEQEIIGYSFSKRVKV